MSLFKAKARQTTGVERVSEGADVYLRALRDGSLAIADFLTMMSLEGRVFNASCGVLTTPITLTAGAMTATTPDVGLLVPAGTTVIPVEIRLQVEAVGTDAIFECMATSGYGGSGTFTAVTPTNLRSDNPRSSVCTIGYTMTAVAQTGNFSEFWRDGVPKFITKTPNSATASVLDAAYTYQWKLTDTGVFPVLIGAAQLMTYSSTQAGTGFWKIKWVELPSTAVS